MGKEDTMKMIKFKILSIEVILSIFLGMLILIPGRIVGYWQGWAYLTIFTIANLAMTIYFLKHDQTLMVKRLKMGTKSENLKSQKILKLSFLVLFISVCLISAVDHRCEFVDIPISLTVGADILLVLSFYLCFWVLKVNSFASAAVEISKNQRVIMSGPYAIVRHPWYFASFIIFVISPIALDSLLGIIPGILITITLIFRILDEEKYLKINLPGYSDYCKIIKYRLIPFIW